MYIILCERSCLHQIFKSISGSYKKITYPESASTAELTKSIFVIALNKVKIKIKENIIRNLKYKLLEENIICH